MHSPQQSQPQPQTMRLPNMDAIRRVASVTSTMAATSSVSTSPMSTSSTSLASTASSSAPPLTVDRPATRTTNLIANNTWISVSAKDASEFRSALNHVSPSGYMHTIIKSLSTPEQVAGNDCQVFLVERSGLDRQIVVLKETVEPVKNMDALEQCRELHQLLDADGLCVPRILEVWSCVFPHDTDPELTKMTTHVIQEYLPQPSLDHLLKGSVAERAFLRRHISSAFTAITHEINRFHEVGQAIHGDLQPAHLLLSGETLNIAHFIDLDCARWRDHTKHYVVKQHSGSAEQQHQLHFTRALEGAGAYLDISTFRRVVIENVKGMSSTTEPTTLTDWMAILRIFRVVVRAIEMTSPAAQVFLAHLASTISNPSSFDYHELLKQIACLTE